MSFLTSSPIKTTNIPGPDDSGVSVQLSDLTTNSSESGESDHLNPDQRKDTALTVDDGKTLCFLFSPVCG